MKILFVGGTFDDDGGRRSSLVDKIADAIIEVTDEVFFDLDVYNGGEFDKIEEILESSKDYDAVLWWANVPNDKPKLRDVKSINQKTMLITSKRNDKSLSLWRKKYSFQELINRALQAKANLCVEFSKQDDGQFKMMLFDPLGNAWYDGFNVKEFAKVLLERTKYLSEITRKRCIPTDITSEIPNNEEFFSVVKDYAEAFHSLIHPEEGVTRFLGNSSFREEQRTRCERGFPSFRDGDTIFVSRRNVDKRYIDKDNFVPTKLDADGNVLYSGENKPSVDTPIQLKLYEALPEINYMIHAHVYIDDAPYTENMVPCGGIEEVDEVLSAIDNNFGSRTGDFYAINLIGHGCIVMANNVEQLKNLPFRGRVLPEKHNLEEKENRPITM